MPLTRINNFDFLIFLSGRRRKTIYEDFIPGLLLSGPPLMAELNEESRELILPNLEECAKLYYDWQKNVKNKEKLNTRETLFNLNKARDALIKALTQNKDGVTNGKIKREKESGQTITLKTFIIHDDNIWQLLTSTKQVRI